MISTNNFTDQLAIFLSITCAVHCLVMPITLLLLPSVVALQFTNETFHSWMVVAVVPTSIYGLLMGCRKHEHYQLLIIGSIGIGFLVLAIVLGENILNELGEKVLTLLGALIVTFGHYRNFRLCQKQINCHSCEN